MSGPLLSDTHGASNVLPCKEAHHDDLANLDQGINDKIEEPENATKFFHNIRKYENKLLLGDIL
jgi:hypothetical protein